MYLIGQKLFGIPKRLHYAIIIAFKRFWRILKHFTHLFDRRGDTCIASHFLNWFVELFFYILDFIGIAEVYEILVDLLKFRARPLTGDELEMAKSIFGTTIDFLRIRIDQRALIGPRQMQITYVSFYTINTWGKLSIPLLVHELTHIWQYEKYGAVYIPKALRAQKSKPSYDYGGLEKLKQMIQANESIECLNLEQQADLTEDYYLLISGKKPKWGNATKNDIGTYLHFIKQFQE